MFHDVSQFFEITSRNRPMNFLQSQWFQVLSTWHRGCIKRFPSLANSELHKCHSRCLNWSGGDTSLAVPGWEPEPCIQRRDPSELVSIVVFSSPCDVRRKSCDVRTNSSQQRRAYAYSNRACRDSENNRRRHLICNSYNGGDEVKHFNTEGQWMQVSEMRQWLNDLLKGQTSWVTKEFTPSGCSGH